MRKYAVMEDIFNTKKIQIFKKGEIVKEVAEYGHVLILEKKDGQRFSAKKELLTEI